MLKKGVDAQDIADFMMDNDHDDDSEVDDENDAKLGDTGEDANIGDSQGEAGSEMAVVEQTHEKDSSARRIKAMRALIKKTLFDSSCCTDRGELAMAIEDMWTAKDGLTDRELNWMVTLVITLKPFIPDKDTPRNNILLRLPIVLIANIVQRVAGYGQFAREICPYISPAKIHALPVDASTMFEMVATSATSQNYIICDKHKIPITSAAWAVRCKKSTLASFFDIDKIEEICKNHKLDL